TLAEATMDLYRANLAALRGFFGSRRVTTRVRGVGVEQTIPGKRLDEITPSELLSYRVWRRTARRGAGTQTKLVSDAALNRDQQFLTMVLNHAVAEKLIAANPIAGFRKLKEQRKGRRMMTQAEVARLLLAADEDYKPFLLASVFTGCRPCELRAVRWRDVHFDNAKLRIDRKKVKGGDVIDMHPTLAEELRRVRDRRAAETKRPVPTDDFVFLSSRGTPWHNMRKAWSRALAAAGLAGSGLTPYATRHSFACHYLTCGGNLVDLASQLGHSDVKTTMVYSQMMDERRRAGVMAMDWSAPVGMPTTAPAPAAAAESVA
ncbi:MAG: tyrosine-type recombinase/integrase, partial [Planctomycetes bacterium]|nr:tyrosine-type recombinase/integrase [Planctomycetota bacterium]